MQRGLILSDANNEKTTYKTDQILAEIKLDILGLEMCTSAHQAP